MPRPLSLPRTVFWEASSFTSRIVGHPEAILQGVDLMDAVDFRRAVVRHRGSQAPFFDSGEPVVGFTTLDPPDLGPLHFVALGAFGRWNVGPWSPAVEAIWEGKPPGG